MAAIGIDLGTTNSLISYWTENGPALIPNILGLNLTPSVVSVDDNDEILVGQVARERLITHPHLTASTFKRYMGTRKTYELGKYKFSPEELSSFVLKSLKADAEAFLGHSVDEAVISVPAYFNDLQRRSTKYAAELAGFKVDRLVTEPTAAAIAYGLHQMDTETKFMVFDLGGGTFDVSILELFEGIMEVKAIAGDNSLGGEDFTEILIDHLTEQLKINPNSLTKKELAALYKQAEICKRGLSDGQTGCMVFQWNEESHQITVNRELFDKLASQLLMRLRHPVERAMRDVELKSKDLDAVILIGGATRMPMIRSVVGRMFGVLPYTNINPDEAVAMGAAIQAALRERNELLEEVVLTDVCPFTLGTEVGKTVGSNFEGGYFHPIIERNTTVPVSRVERFVTPYDNQTTLDISVYQGESHRIAGNVKLGSIEIRLPLNRAGMEPVDVRFTYDINGILEVEIITVSTGAKKRMIIENSGCNLTKKEIDERFEALKHIKIHHRDRTENRLLIARGERLYEEALGDKREYISQLLTYFTTVLSTQNDKEIATASAELQRKFEELEGWFDY